MADIFISYKREERSEVERLATALRGLGFDVWFDASLSAGEAFSDQIDREVKAAKVVLVCWSPNATGSKWVKAEALEGFNRDSLVQTQIAGPDGFAPPTPFTAVHMEDLRAWVDRPSQRDKAWLSVLRRVGQLTNRDDVAEWGALGEDASVAQVQAWFETHKSSPLVLQADGYLQELEAEARERDAAEAAARERLERLAAEKAAADEAKARADAEKRATERAAEEQRKLEAAERAKARAEAEHRAPTRRSIVLGGGALVGVGGVGYIGWLWFDQRELGGVVLEHTLTGHGGWVRSAAFSPDGRRVVTASYDTTAKIWRLAD